MQKQLDNEQHWFNNTSLIHCYHPQTKFGARLYFQKCVSRILFTGGGSASVHAGISPPGTRHPPGADLPGPGTPRSRPTWHSACWEIRSTSGRYASYWNAILFVIVHSNFSRYYNTVQQANYMLECYISEYGPICDIIWE